MNAPSGKRLVRLRLHFDTTVNLEIAYVDFETKLRAICSLKSSPMITGGRMSRKGDEVLDRILVPKNVLPIADTGSGMKPDESQLVLLSIEDKKKFEDATTYIYAGSGAAAVHKPITVYKEKNANAYVVAGRYAGVTETHLKYKPLNEEERKLVAEKLGSGKIVKFLSNEPAGPT